MVDEDSRRLALKRLSVADHSGLDLAGRGDCVPDDCFGIFAEAVDFGSSDAAGRIRTFIS